MDTTTTPDRTVEPSARFEAHTADRLLEQRTLLRMRHAQALTSLMAERDDLRGVHALADHFDEAVRRSA